MLIKPSEISAKARKWFYEFLSAAVEGDAFFPKEIRFTKVKQTWVRDHFQQLHEDLRALRQESKSVKGVGYSIVWNEVANRTVGKNEFPVKISIDTEMDFISLLDTERRNAYKHFTADAKEILATFPVLLPWVKQNPQKVVKYTGEWIDLIKVGKYFVSQHQRNRYYIRELPVEIHTKFIEQHKGILYELLNLLLDDSLIDHAISGSKDHHFERRFGLKYDETQIRFRSLNPLDNRISDFSVRHSDFAKYEIPGSQVIITENKMNFLTLPKLEDTLAIWGGGINIHLLRHANWLSSKHIYYWGDIDAHGLWILSQFRNYFSKVTSLLMDWETFRKFEYGGRGKPISDVTLNGLSTEELELFHHLKTHNLRLEQEKIPFYWIERRIKDCMAVRNKEIK